MGGPNYGSGMNDGGSRNPNHGADMETLDAERQQRKIITAFLYGTNGHPNSKILNEFEAPPMPKGGRDIFLDSLAKDYIPLESERELLSMVNDPVSQEGLEKVKEAIQSKHELRILGQMTRGDLGFAQWDDPAS